ncbi:hypothetical protein RM553_15220 [Zunongwangia sp. F363]|uniref:Beta-lactamase-inhibitor-like PepSY-like domain-containing protein n=1 Tax=Autumnicola tepida TaxID=3075595 RepID=A0ABU3CCY8_9FLAO|nr:hypothetical protein [Zunongwangia sp. F363]MDT0644186.1 hypothetical protein [Zunongwangia sp. F363]
MKNLILLLTLLAVCTYGNAQNDQEITQLEEAKVGFAPLDAKIVRMGNSFSYKVKEQFAGEFVRNPIGFMNANFDINNFIAEVDNRSYDSYIITFENGNGYLQADFDKDGNLERTFQKFKDIPLPTEISRAVLRDHKGWTITKNKLVARGTGEYLDKATYRMKLEKDGEKKRIKIDGREEGIAGLASN